MKMKAGSVLPYAAIMLCIETYSIFFGVLRCGNFTVFALGKACMVVLSKCQIAVALRKCQLLEICCLLNLTVSSPWPVRICIIHELAGHGTGTHMSVQPWKHLSLNAKIHLLSTWPSNHSGKLRN